MLEIAYLPGEPLEMRLGDERALAGGAPQGLLVEVDDPQVPVRVVVYAAPFDSAVPGDLEPIVADGRAYSATATAGNPDMLASPHEYGAVIAGGFGLFDE